MATRDTEPVQQTPVHPNEPIHKPGKPELHGTVVPGEAGYNLGLAGFIVSFFSGVVGLILSAVALGQSRSIGRKNTLAYAGLIIGIVRTALMILFIIGFVILGIIGAANGDYNDRSGSPIRSYYQDQSTDSPAQTY